MKLKTGLRQTPWPALAANGIRSPFNPLRDRSTTRAKQVWLCIKKAIPVRGNFMPDPCIAAPAGSHLLQLGEAKMMNATKQAIRLRVRLKFALSLACRAQARRALTMENRSARNSIASSM